MSSGEALAARRRFAVSVSPLLVAAWAAVALGIGLRLFARPGLPLWLDETWTGAIIAQDSLHEVLRQTLLDANAPLYFALMHGWSLLFGLSNGAMRFPSLLFGALAPLMALIPIKAVPRDVRYLWCALLALWFPAILYAQEARCYALLLFLVTACMIAYLRLLERPDLRRAALWAFIGALCILTHYHAVILIGFQGLAYLALFRGRALRTWPAALAFLPALGWMLVHLPHVAQYADPQIAWFPRLGPGDIPGLVFFLLGGAQVMIGLICLAIIPLVVRAPRPGLGPAPDETPSRLVWVTVATAGLGVVAILVAATQSNSFTTRYLIPFAPALMLGIAMAAVRFGRGLAALPLAVALVFALSAVSRAVEGRDRPLKVYNFQAASDVLMAADVRSLAFLWDNPIGQICDPGQLADLGGFFFRRAGRPVAVESLSLRPGEDPNARLLAAASGQQSGILWLYDLNVRGTAASSHPPAIESDPAWQCRQFGVDHIGVMACTRRTAPQ